MNPPSPTPVEPWIETRAGTLFFLNALLAAPLAVVVVPLALGWALRGAGLVQGPSAVLDTIPMMARWAVPGVGWLSAPAAWLAYRTRQITGLRGARVALMLFLVAHLAVVVWTVARWVGA
jgi:hypothetical protein